MLRQTHAVTLVAVTLAATPVVTAETLVASVAVVVGSSETLLAECDVASVDVPDDVASVAADAESAADAAEL